MTTLDAHTKGAGVSQDAPFKSAGDAKSWRDLMEGAARLEVPVHEHGFVALVDVMPRLAPVGQTADAAIVQAARVSYGEGTKRVNEDRGLIRYLMRHRHTTPFEMVEFKFHVRLPIFVARQWIRHRTANVNEYSARYSILPDRFFRPTVDEIRLQSEKARLHDQLSLWNDSVRKQSKTNKQVGDQPIATATAQEFLEYLAQAESNYQEYLRLTEHGVARELARVALPQSVYTEWYWKCDLHNTLNFLALRLDEHAQVEIRDYARAMLALIEPIVPVTVEAWRDYALEGARLTRLEIEALKQGKRELATTNKREQQEWDAKRTRLGLSD